MDRQAGWISLFLLSLVVIACAVGLFASAG
jgi:hypothetical protein